MTAEQIVSIYTEDGHRADPTIGLNSANRVCIISPGGEVMQLDAAADVEPLVEAVRLAAELGYQPHEAQSLETAVLLP